MITSRTALWSRYLIFFILATLPLERIPSLELTNPISATIRLSQVAGLILIAINLPLLWSKRAQLLRGPWKWLGMFLIVSVASAITALNPQHAVIVLAYTSFVAVLAWTISLRFERNQLRNYAVAIILSALITCGFGLYQFFGDLLGLPIKYTGLREQYTSQVFGFPRIQSTGLEPLYYDNYLLIPSAIIMAYLLRRRSWKLIAALTAIATIIFVNVSRGAIVAFLLLALGSVTVGLLRRKKIGAISIIVACVMGVILATSLIGLGSSIAKNKSTNSKHAVANFTKQATNVSSGESSIFRTISRNAAITTFKAHPILGVGPGNFGRAAHQLDAKNFADNNAIVNNEPLEILAETGVLGGLTLLGFAVSLMAAVLRKWRYITDSTLKVWVFGLTAAILAITVQYQLFSTLYITHVWVVIGLLIGCLSVIRPSKQT